MKRLRKIAFESAVVGGWILIVCGSLLYVAEKSGILTESINKTLRTAMQPRGEELSITGVELDWFEPAVALEGIRLESEEGVDLEVGSARFVFAPWLGRTWGLERIEVERARLQLSASLSSRVRNFMQSVGGSTTTKSERGKLPSLVVNGLDVEIKTPEWGTWPLGEVDLRYGTSGDAPPRLSGRLRSRAWWAGENAKDIQIYGSEIAPGVMELHAVARGLRVDLEEIPEGVPLEMVEAYDPAVRLDLQSRGTVYLDGSRPPRGSLRVSIAEGSATAPGVEEPVRNLALALEAMFEPTFEQNLFDFDAWSGRADIAANWRALDIGTKLRVGRFAREGRLAEAWLTVPQVLARDEYIEEMIALMHPIEHIGRYVANALGGRGNAHLTVAMSLADSWNLEERVIDHLHQFVHAEATGEAELAYHGPADDQDERRFGFPLGVDEISGDFLFCFKPKVPQRSLMGIVDLVGNHGAGPVRCSGLISSRSPDQVEQFPPLYLDLDIEADELATDDRMRAGAYGLRGVIPEDELWKLYQPEDGALDLKLRLVMERGRANLASLAALDLNGIDLRWNPIPAPLRNTRGMVEVLTNGNGRALTRLRTSSELATAEAFDLTARISADREAGVQQFAEARVHKISLKGDDVRVLASKEAAVKEAMSAFGPKGFVDARCTWESRGIDETAELIVDIAPREPCEIDPQVFTMNTKELRGRVLVRAQRTPRESEEASATPAWNTMVRMMPLIGTWGAGIDVALSGEFGNSGVGRVQLQGAGIRSSNRRLLGSLAESIAGNNSAGARMDVTSLRVDGRLDFGADLLLEREGDEARIGKESEFLVFLRENDLVSERSFNLKRLDGRVQLDIHTARLYADSLKAILGTTPVQLTDPLLHEVDGVMRFETQLDAQGLPLDREHLSLFLDEETLEAILTELKWRGTIDVHDAALTFDSRKDGTTRLTLQGPATLSDVFMQMGVPVSIRSAQANVDSLVFEGGRTRGWGHLSDLFGTVAGRSIEQAQMLVSYVEPRVSLENIDARFIDSEGHVFPLGNRSSVPGESPGGSAFAIDLRAPFPFEAAFALRDVDVAGLTQGLFATDIANSGRLQGELRLNGNLEELLEIRGSGALSLTRGQLWSVPVVRTLFSQLGLDDTAVFDSMGTRFEISDGVIYMKELEAHSPILKLVGEGTLDFDGSLHHDLEVNYSLVDKLGFLRSILYSIQNSLLRIAIRGDMERPQIILKNLLSDLRGEQTKQALPLPDVSGLPRRF